MISLLLDFGFDQVAYISKETLVSVTQAEALNGLCLRKGAKEI